MAYTDQYYQDAAGGLFFLSAQDQANAADEAWTGPTLPDPAWTVVTAEQADAIINPLPSAAALLAYAEARRAEIAAGGITVNVGGEANPVACAVDTSASGRADMLGMAVDASGNLTWYQSSGAVVITAAQLAAINAGVAAFISAVWAAYQAVAVAIAAGTISTIAQIDAASWPGNS